MDILTRLTQAASAATRAADTARQPTPQRGIDDAVKSADNATQLTQQATRSMSSSTPPKGDLARDLQRAAGTLKLASGDPERLDLIQLKPSRITPRRRIH